MTKEEANKEIAAQIVLAYAALTKAQTLADKHGLNFSFNPAYGMGGYYYSKSGYEELFDVSDATYDLYGWNPSSSDC